MTAKTRADLIEAVADRFGIYKKLTVTGGSTTTIVDTGDLFEVDDAWNGHLAYVLTDAGGGGAAPEGEERPVTDYDQSAATLTVSPAFSAAVASGDTVELLPVSRARLVRAINEAVRAATDTWPVVKRDTSTITLATDDYDYSLPTDLVRLLSVWYREETDEPWTQVPGRSYRVVGTPGAQVLVFDRLGSLEAGEVLALEYLARPSELATDAATLGVGEPAERELVAFVVEHALGVLHEQATRGGKFREELTLAQSHYQRAEEMRRRAPIWGTPGTVRTGRQPRARG